MRFFRLHEILKKGNDIPNTTIIMTMKQV